MKLRTMLVTVGIMTCSPQQVCRFPFVSISQSLTCSTSVVSFISQQVSGQGGDDDIDEKDVEDSHDRAYGNGDSSQMGFVLLPSRSQSYSSS